MDILILIFFNSFFLKFRSVMNVYWNVTKEFHCQLKDTSMDAHINNLQWRHTWHSIWGAKYRRNSVETLTPGANMNMSFPQRTKKQTLTSSTNRTIPVSQFKGKTWSLFNESSVFSLTKSLLIRSKSQGSRFLNTNYIPR